MAASKTIGFGVTLSSSTTGTIGQILSLEVSGIKTDFVDTTAADNTSACRTFLPTVIDPGEITFECNHDGSATGTANDLMAVFLAKTKENWTVTFPDTTTWVCEAFITNFSIKNDVEGKVTNSVTLKCTGLPVFTDLAA